MSNKNTSLKHKLLTSFAIFSGIQVFAQEKKPNIIFFLVDDMGWQDTSVPFYGDTQSPINQRYNTPNMVRLAKQGVKFTNAYACSVSTPTRCSLLTGMNAARHRVTNWTMFYDAKTDARNDVLATPDWNYNGVQPANTKSEKDKKNATLATPLPQILSDNGYYTILCGKAHFGTMGTSAANPENLGFQVSIAGNHIGSPSSYQGLERYGEGTNHAVPGLEKYKGTDTFLSEALTREAMAALEKPIAENKPFYLYMSHYAVHAPYNADKRFKDKYHDKYDAFLKDTLSDMEQNYATLVEGMDKSLGDLMDFIEKKGVADNTIIIFMSDNGGQGIAPRQGVHNRQPNYPARGGKGSAFLGGVKEPMIVSWKGVAPQGKTSSQVVMVEDFFPSILEMAGVKHYNTYQTVDGKSFVFSVRNPNATRKRSITWHFPNLWGETQNIEEGYGATSSFLKGDYHLIYSWQTGQVRLYNIKKDIGEQNDLSKKMPALAKKMAKELTINLKRYNALRPIEKASGKEYPYPYEIFTIKK